MHHFTRFKQTTAAEISKQLSSFLTSDVMRQFWAQHVGDSSKGIKLEQKFSHITVELNWGGQAATILGKVFDEASFLIGMLSIAMMNTVVTTTDDDTTSVRYAMSNQIVS